MVKRTCNTVLGTERDFGKSIARAALSCRPLPMPDRGGVGLSLLDLGILDTDRWEEAIPNIAYKLFRSMIVHLSLKIIET